MRILLSENSRNVKPFISGRILEKWTRICLYFALGIVSFFATTAKLQGFQVIVTKIY